LEPPVRALLARLGWLLTFTLFLVMALQNLGSSLLPLVAGVGVAGAALPWPLKALLGNLVAGLSIIFASLFVLGNTYPSWRRRAGRDHHPVHNDPHPSGRSRVVIPNRKIVGEILHNFGTVRQIDIVVGVAYDTDINSAVAAISEVLQATRACYAIRRPSFRRCCWGTRRQHRDSSVGGRCGLPSGRG